MQRVVHGLHIGRTLGAVEVEAGVVAVDAGLDVLFAVLKELVDPLGIDEVLTADAHRVDATLGNLLGSELGLHLTGADDRLGGELADMLDVLNVAVGRHIDRRMRPVPGVVGTVIAVEHVVAGVLEILDRLFGFRHIAAELNKLLAGDGALTEALRLGDDRVAQRHGEVLAAQLLNLLHDLNGKAVAVLERSAVFVGTVVHVGNGKLVKEVALVNGVDLHTVNAGIHKHLRGLAKGLDHFADLFLCQRTGLDLRIPAVGGLGGGRADILDVQNALGNGAKRLLLKHIDHQLVDRHAAAHAGGELDEELGARLMEFRHPLGKLAEHTLVLIEPVTAGNAHRVAHALHAGQHQTDVVLGAVEDVIRRFLVEVARLQPAEEGRAAHRHLHDAVFDLAVADLPRGKQGTVLFVHAIILLLYLCGGSAGFFRFPYRIYYNKRRIILQPYLSYLFILLSNPWFSGVLTHFFRAAR